MFGGAHKWRCFLSEFYGINEELQIISFQHTAETYSPIHFFVRRFS